MDVVTGGAITLDEYLREHCHDCRFFGDFGDGSGTCHRYPPTRHWRFVVSRFPVVNEVDWCGEWQTCAEAKDGTAPPK